LNAPSTPLGSTLKQLYDRAGSGRKFGLDRIEAACARFGNPERSFQAVHIAGTNGKGSVAALTESMLRSSGRRTGLFTSPHLVRFAERIQIDGQQIADDMLDRLLSQVMEREPDLTFYEVATLTGFLAFQESKVDVAVLEVGLGGRLDATNVIPAPRVAAITRVSFDHTRELGDSIAAIATEKAAIIKAGSAVALGKLHPDAREVIEKRAAEVGAHILPLASPEPVSGARIVYPRPAFYGTNLAVANTIAHELGVSPDQMTTGIESTQWPGRNELLHRGGKDLTLLDCAHNADATVALSHVLDPQYLGCGVNSRRDVALVFGAVQGKRWKAMLARLQPAAAHRIFVTPPIPRGIPAETMAAEVGGEVAADMGEALKIGRGHVGEKGLVVVTGSTFLVGAARAILLGSPTDPAIDM
jgi:dihydrofolate synthase / folylpolyglutamate synthase